MAQSCLGGGAIILWYRAGILAAGVTDVCIGFDGQSETKTSPSGRIVGGPQAAAMGLNNGAADPKSYAGAVNLGGKEGIKDLVRLLRCKPHAGIADRDLKPVAIHSLR